MIRPKLIFIATLIWMPLLAQNQTVDLSCNDLSRFNITEIRAKAGSNLTINFKNSGRLPSISHNVVVLQQGTNVDAFGNAAMNAKASDYIPDSYRDRIIAHTKMLAAGQSESLTFKVPPAGRYTFICSYPGHHSISRGTLISE